MSTKRFLARHGVDNNNQTLTNVADPVNSTDAVNKGISDAIHVKANSAFGEANTKVRNYRQNTAPSTASVSDTWTNIETGLVYENWGTYSSPIWVETGPSNLPYNNSPGSIVATSGSFSGDVIIYGNTRVESPLTVSYAPTATENVAIHISAANTKGGIGFADVLRFTNASLNSSAQNKYIRLSTVGNLQIINSSYSGNIFDLYDNGDLYLSGNVITTGIQPGYSANRPAFRVVGANTTNNLSATQNGTGQLNVNNWSQVFSQGGGLNQVTGTFTAPVAGLYQVNLTGRNSGYSSGISQIAVKHNSDVCIMIEWSASSTMNHTGGSCVVKMSPGDTLKLFVLAGQINFDFNDNWSVAYIG